jgi:hypothetical protein
MGSFDWRPDDHGDGSSGHTDLKKDLENRPHGTRRTVPMASFKMMISGNSNKGWFVLAYTAI